MKFGILSSSAPANAISGSASIAEILSPIYEVAGESSSLVASRHTVRFGNRRYEIPRFLLLGQRGGGKPISVGLFAGLDAHSVTTSLAVSRLLLQFELNPLLAKDYALFGYPIVNVEGFEPAPATRAEFEARFAAEDPEEDVLFFRSELEHWSFDGHIVLSIDPDGDGFHATSRSRVLAEEVIGPALETIATSLPVASQPVALRPADRHNRLADASRGEITSPVGVRLYPFEIEVFAPARLAAEQQITGLFLSIQEILWKYRRFISHGQNI